MNLIYPFTIVKMLLILYAGYATAQSLSPTSKTFNPVQVNPANRITHRQTDAPLYEERISRSFSAEITPLREELKETDDTQTRSNFQRSYDELLRLDPDSFSLTKAVYLSEVAFYDHQFAFSDFEKGIKKWATLVRQILNREKLSTQNNTALNYGIQKLYTSDNLYEHPDGNYIIPKLHYDFEDYLGEKNPKQLFVTKMLQTGTGQCHSMPLFYLCLAEQLHAKAYLSLAPNHTFIKFFDEHGRLYNFETTNGHLASTAWLMQSTYVTSLALKKKTFLDTLSNRRLYAQCLSDLTMNYLEKVKRYDKLSVRMIQKILDVDSNNVTGLMLLANYYRDQVMTIASKSGYPPMNKFENYPTLFAAYQEQKSTQHF